MSLRTLTTTLILLAVGTLGSFAAAALGWPMPYVLGSLLTSAIIATSLSHRLPAGYGFPQKLRSGFIAVIGLVIGAQVTSTLFSQAPKLIYSFSALMVFVVVAQGMNYLIFKHVGKYDRQTAFFAGSPGGLFESISLGEEAGADLQLLMLQQFLRIILVVTMVPIGFSWWYGAPVGSASGISLSHSTTTSIADIVVLVGVGALGMYLGKIFRLPAPQLIGPIIAAAALNLSGIVEINVPNGLISVAQVVVGTGLGMRFRGMTHRLLLRGAGLSFLSVGAMLILGLLLSVILVPLTGQPLDVLLISFAPGGVTEMTLVALSLSANPAFVTLHHLFRIIVTVILLGQSKRFFKT